MSEQICGCWYTLEEGMECVHEKQEKIVNLAKNVKQNTPEALRVLAFIGAGFSSGQLGIDVLKDGRLKIIDWHNVMIAWEGERTDWSEALRVAHIFPP